MKFRVVHICLVLIVLTANVWVSPARPENDERSQKVERTIAVDPAVTVSLCVMSGNVSVRGWDKNEVSARSSDAAQIELRRRDVPGAAGQAMKLEVFVVDKADALRVKDNCQAYSDLELNVPRTASVHVQTRDGDISIAEVGMAFAGSQNGDICIERVSRAVEVDSVSGSISIKNSTGRASVTSIGGGIEVVNLRPSAPPDSFEAVSVSGDLTLTGVSHSKFNARTTSGNMHLSGPLTQGGRYGFKTTSGDVTLTLPANSSFSLKALISNDGEIITDFPLTIMPDTPPPTTPAPSAPAVSGVPPKGQPPAAPAPSAAPKASPAATIVKVTPQISRVVVTAPVVAGPVYTLRRFNAVCGDGDATISVASFSGTLHLQKEGN
ncbi:MAG: DUF4097 family beta strand repeat-containing protein [Pyrinomonadaceae bacterium]